LQRQHALGNDRFRAMIEASFSGAQVRQRLGVRLRLDRSWKVHSDPVSRSWLPFLLNRSVTIL
jgi:hypothetical protein